MASYNKGSGNIRDEHKNTLKKRLGIITVKGNE